MEFEGEYNYGHVSDRVYFGALLGGQIKCCTPVRPSVWPSVSLSVSFLRFTQNRKATENRRDTTMDRSIWESKYEVRRTKVKVI